MSAHVPGPETGGTEAKGEKRPSHWVKPDYQVVETALEVTTYFSVEV